MATTPNVGVRVLTDLRATLASIDTRDQSAIGMSLPAPDADNTLFPIDEPVLVSTDNAELIEEMGPGEARDAINQIASAGIVANVLFVRANAAANATLDARMAAIVGSAGARTGIHALLEARSHTGYEPGLLIAPGHTATRPDDAANPVISAMETVATRIHDCIVIADGPTTSDAAAIEAAEDFATSMRVVMTCQGAKVSIGGQTVTRSMSPHIAAGIVKRDKEVATPFKASWNRRLVGVLGVSRTLEYRPHDATCQSNMLAQAGLHPVVEGSKSWGPFTTATDPIVRPWRSLKRVRTRFGIERALREPLMLYLSEDITPDMVTLLYRSIDDYLDQCEGISALIGHEIIWDAKLNTATQLRDGGMRVKTRWEETPELIDLNIATEPMPEAYDILEAAIAAALLALGDANIRVAA